MLQTDKADTGVLHSPITDEGADHEPVKTVILWKGPTLKEQQQEASLPHKRFLNMADVTEKSGKVSTSADGTTQFKHTFAFVNLSRVLIKVRNGQSPRKTIERANKLRPRCREIRYLIKTRWEKPKFNILQPHTWLWKNTKVEQLGHPNPRDESMQKYIATICNTPPQ